MRQNKVLYTGFKKRNERDTCSSLELLNRLDDKDIFLFTNNFNAIQKEVSEVLKTDWDEIVMFGQKPVTKKLYIERCAKREGRKLTTNWNLTDLEKLLNSKDVDFRYSDDAGNSFCNYAYFEVLSQVKAKDFGTKVIFIHIPYVKNFRQFEDVVDILNEY